MVILAENKKGNQLVEDTPNNEETKELLNESKRKESNAYFYWGYLIFILMFIPITVATTLIGDVPLPKQENGTYGTISSTYISVYERRNYYSESFGLGKFIQWNLMCLTGFVFVTIVNLRNRERANPFLGRFGTYKDFIGLTILAPLLYFTAPIIFMRSHSSMQRGCSSEGISGESNTQNFGVEGNSFHNAGLIYFIQAICEGIAGGIYNFGSIMTDHYTCYEFTFSEVFGYNYMIVCSFFLGCNMTHMNSIVECVLGKPARNLSLSIEALKTWGIREALAMAFFSTLSMGYLFYMFWLYARAGILALYGLLVVFI
ncbi:unnamed protein product [Moneuplotes crassus]|uniref:Uncharacterized protein n=1 Tax=Euplotes crassus TaxID=5936 RepID=A0AAD1XH49_EUPCR|nr:unnamed protein product [Moneuplotes crassus]